MKTSQFGNTPGTLEATLDELVALARHLRATPTAIPSRLTRLEGLSQMLSYFSSPPMLTRDEPAGPTLDTHCAFENCTKTWRDEDACLLNFARGGEPALWLCRDHHPPPGDGGIRPPGWTPPLSERERLDASRKAALAKLDRGTELPLINSRV